MRRSSRKARLTGSITVAALVLPLSLMSVGGAAAAPPHDDNNAGGNQPPSNSSAPNKAPAVESRVKDIIKVNGRQFRDLNDNGTLDPYEDWRLTDEQRAADLVSRMTLEEKAGLMQITSLRGDIPDLVENRNIRYLIIRDNPTAFELAERANTHQQTAEATRLGIPLVFTSNPRNHVNPDLEFGISEAAGQFSSWPGSLGLAATNDLDLIRDFAEIAQDEWRSSGIQKAYAYQLETATEPRWRRINGTFGESPDLNSAIATELTLGFQGEELSNESVAQTVKHFPGDGAVLRGLDPHNEPGKWAVYPTAGSLEDYQLPPFQAAIDAGTSSVMSYYNVPSNAMSADQLDIADWYAPGQQFEEVAGAYNKAIVNGLLGDRMGFKGYVNSDSGILTNRAFGVENLTMAERFAKAIEAGRACSPTTTTRRDSSRRSRPACSPRPTWTPRCNCCSRRSSRSACSRTRMSTPTSPSRSPMTLPRRPVPTRPTTSRSCCCATTSSRCRSTIRMSGRRSSSSRSSPVPMHRADDRAEGAHHRAGSLVQLVDTLEEATDALVWVRPNVFEYPDDSTVEIELGDLTGVDVARVQEIEAAVPTVLAVNLATRG